MTKLPAELPPPYVPSPKVPPPSAPPLDGPQTVWGDVEEPLFGRGVDVADAVGQGHPSVGSEVTVRAVVIGHRRDGAVVLEVQGCRAHIAVPAQGIGEPSRTLQRSSNNGIELLRVPPPLTPRRMCDSEQWKRKSVYGLLPVFFAYLLFAVISWAVTASLFVIAIGLLPLILGVPVFKYAAMTWRWLAHRHLDMVLELAPPHGGMVVSYPSARIPDGTFCGYVANCHTWACLVYIIFMSLPLSIVAFALSVLLLPFSLVLMILVIGIPLLIASTNVMSCLAIMLRSVAVCMLATKLGDGGWSRTTADLDVPVPAVPLLDDAPEAAPPAAPASPPAAVPSPHAPRPAAAKVDDTSCESNDDWSPDAAEVIEILSGGAPAAVPIADKCQGRQRERAERPVADLDAFLIQRDRSPEEIVAVSRFQVAWERVNSNICRVQDLVIAPPREPGMGPRHFIRIADELNETTRLKLIKAYKATFSAMYVHIVDADEQRRYYGPDFSGAYE